MTKDFFNNLLKYHQNLVDPDFLRSILSKINQRNKKRSRIILLFSILGTLTCSFILLILKPSFVFLESSNTLSIAGATCVSLFLMWLIFEETQVSN